MYALAHVSVLLVLVLAVPAGGFLRAHVHRVPRLHATARSCPAAGQQLGRDRAAASSCTRRFQLALRARGPPRDRGRPRQPGDGRRRHADRRRVPRQPWQARLGYRLIRNPLVMLGLGPIWALLLEPRLVPGGPAGDSGADPASRTRRWSADRRRAVRARSAGRPSCWCSSRARCSPGAAGIWLFYVQHQFEDVYWEHTADWSYVGLGAARELLPEAAEGAPVLHRQHRAAPRPPHAARGSRTTTSSARTTRTRCSTTSRRCRCGTASARCG